MNLLLIGDVVSEPGCACVRRLLPALKKQYAVDLVVANAENSAVGNGMTPHSAKYLLDSGCDILTGGNHTLRRREVFPLLCENPHILRPANFPRACPGRGLFVYDKGKYQVAVINLIGQVYLEAGNSPFETANRLLRKLETPIVLVDFHAEATGEKGALGYYLDGRVSAVIGTHTHVQTNDARILPKGTGFLSDVGMVGPTESILGVAPRCVVRRMTTHLPTRFEVEDTPCGFHAVLLAIDEATGRCTDIQTLAID